MSNCIFSFLYDFVHRFVPCAPFPYQSSFIQYSYYGSAVAITPNFDPTVLPSGMRTSDDPFPAARSAAYAKSYDRRTAEAEDYPRTAPEAKP